METVRIHVSSATDDIIADAIGKWLAQAKHRKERSEKRLSNKTTKSFTLFEDMEEDSLSDNERNTTSLSKDN